MRRRILNYLLERRAKGRLHFALIDPDKVSPKEAGEIARTAAQAGSDAILVGGSLGVLEAETEAVAREAKKSGLPVILFPGALTNAARSADAVLFMHLLNSDDPYYTSVAPVQGAMLVLKLGIEPIPTSYIIIGYGGAAGFIARARIIPYEKPELIAAHALAGAMLGSKIIYLEAGSGAPRPIPPEAVALSKRLLAKAGFDCEALIAVGGGIRTPEAASALAEAGADILVTGTIVEENPEALHDIISAFKASIPGETG